MNGDIAFLREVIIDEILAAAAKSLKLLILFSLRPCRNESNPISYRPEYGQWHK